MKVEISALFGMDWGEDIVVNSHIGDGVHLEEIVFNGRRDELFEGLKAQSPKYYDKMRLREGFENTGLQYTHRFHVLIDAPKSFGHTEETPARQMIMRAIVLSR